MPLCPNCRAIVGVDEHVCQSCGANLQQGNHDHRQRDSSQQWAQDHQQQRRQDFRSQGGQGRQRRQTNDDKYAGLSRRQLLAGGIIATVLAAGGLLEVLESIEGGAGESGNGGANGGDAIDEGDDSGFENRSGESSPEPGDSFDTAPPLEEGRHGPYELGGVEEHHFALDLDVGDVPRITALFSHSEGDIDLEFYDPQKDRSNFSATTNDNETIRERVAESGTYYIKVYTFGGESNDYELAVEI